MAQTRWVGRNDAQPADPPILIHNHICVPDGSFEMAFVPGVRSRLPVHHVQRSVVQGFADTAFQGRPSELQSIRGERGRHGGVHAFGGPIESARP